MHYLITGTSSGLGRYLSEDLEKGNKVDRYARNLKYDRNHYDTIIHCGWNPHISNNYRYIESHIAEVDYLLRISHVNFIFVSTIDVYPDQSSLMTEETYIDARDVVGIYGMTKFLVEMEVAKRACQPMILRPGFLLGKYTRENNITKIAKNSPEINISLDSLCNMVSYNQILSIVQDPKTMVLNVLNKGNLKLKHIIEVKTKDGEYCYRTKNISNAEFNKNYPEIVTSSQKVYDDYVKNVVCNNNS